MSDLPTTEEEWRARLSPERFRILRQGATEPAFTGELWNEKRQGVYRCAGCGTELFSSDTKYESGSGWPSFYQPVDDGRIAEKSDTSYGMVRTEILCSACGGHLGHIFDDGPHPTGLRYCVNSASLELDPGD
ncbi:MAG TPA: peptide-methionine (R)-S-oxide reductase MsrB [Acidimicrobiia bacterium]